MADEDLWLASSSSLTTTISQDLRTGKEDKRITLHKYFQGLKPPERVPKNASKSDTRCLSSGTTSNGTFFDSSLKSETSLTRSSSKTSLSALSLPDGIPAMREHDHKNLEKVGLHLYSDPASTIMAADDHQAIEPARTCLRDLEDHISSSGLQTSENDLLQPTSLPLYEGIEAAKTESLLGEFELAAAPLCGSERLYERLHSFYFVTVFLLSIYPPPVEERMPFLVVVHMVFAHIQISAQHHAFLLLSIPSASYSLEAHVQAEAKLHVVFEDVFCRMGFLVFALVVDVIIKAMMQCGYLHLDWLLLPLVLHGLLLLGELWGRMLPAITVTPLFINGRLIEAIDDNGSQDNFMSKRLTKQLGLRISSKKSSEREGPDGANYCTLGTVSVEARFPRPSQVHDQSVEFHVLASPPYELIVGRRYLHAHDIDTVKHYRSVQRHRRFTELWMCFGAALLATMNPGATASFDFLAISIAKCGVQLEALLDTGAEMNAMSPEAALAVLSTVKGPEVTLHSRTRVVKFIDGRRCTTRHILEFDVRFGDTISKQAFVIIPGLFRGVLLGRAFCYQFEQHKDFKKHKCYKEVVAQNGKHADAPFTVQVASLHRVKEKVKGIWKSKLHKHSDEGHVKTSAELKQEYDAAAHAVLDMHKAHRSQAPNERAVSEVEWSVRLADAKADAERKHTAWQTSITGTRPSTEEPAPGGVGAARPQSPRRLWTPVVAGPSTTATLNPSAQPLSGSSTAIASGAIAWEPDSPTIAAWDSPERKHRSQASTNATHTGNPRLGADGDMAQSDSAATAPASASQAPETQTSTASSGAWTPNAAALQGRHPSESRSDPPTLLPPERPQDGRSSGEQSSQDPSSVAEEPRQSSQSSASPTPPNDAAGAEVKPDSDPLFTNDTR